jgi:hypothetical protein
MKRIFNRETLKIELHFEKSEYQTFTDEQKAELKSGYLWSNYSKAWISRAKEPNLWRAKQIAEKLGFTEEIKEGERLSFAEQVEKTAERAEARANRMEARANTAIERAEQLQKPINDMHGDIAFFTQPNINTSAGRAFKNRREKMFASYERGFEEYQKSAYYKDRAETARKTASSEKYKDKSYLTKRIEETRKSIRAREHNLISYEEILYRLEHGEALKRYDGSEITAEQVQNQIENELEIINALMDKEAFLQDCILACGGIIFGKDNIKTGYIIELQRWGRCEVVGTGPKNITYKILEGGAAGLGGKASYAEIVKILEEKEQSKEAHPFKEGEQFKVSEYSFTDHKVVEKVYTIIKVTDKTVTLQSNSGETIRRTPKKVNIYRDGEVWRLCIVENSSGFFYRKTV